MRHIMVLNSKGGSGKSTIATSLAACYAGRGENVALVDYDRQGSSLDWIARRPENRPKISGVAGFEDRLPACAAQRRRCRHRCACRLLRQAAHRTGTACRDGESCRYCPRPSIIHATTEFIDALLEVGKVERKEVKLAVVANRVRDKR